MRKITFKVDVPAVGTNQAYRRRGYAPGMYMTAEGNTYKQMVACMAHYAIAEEANGKDKKFFHVPDISIQFTYGDKRRHDIDSGIKLTLDAMNGIVYRDDSQICRMEVWKLYEKNKPSVSITVSEAW